MNPENLETALEDLQKAIKDISLGSVEQVVVMAAGRELILNWNDHAEADERIDEIVELERWRQRWQQ